MYCAYGLKIRSEIELPELMVIATNGGSDVIVRYGSIRDKPSVVANRGRGLRVAADEITISWPNVGSFQICNGQKVIVDPAPQADLPLLRLFLLGATLALLLHQRGETIVFHASVVAISGKAVLFVGSRGAGKSGLAAALHTRGHKLLSDDISAITLCGQRLGVLPGYPHFKLWPDTMTEVGLRPQDFPRLRSEVEKRSYRISTGFAQDSLPIGCIFVLRNDEDMEIERLTSGEGLSALLPHWYGARYGMELLQALGLSRHFQECATVAGKAPIFSLSRPSALSDLLEVAKFVESYVATVWSQPEQEAVAIG